MECDDSKRVTLLEPESRGGEIASSGFEFQDYFLVTKIPQFLSFQGFTALAHESIADLEVKYFMPGAGEKIEAFEVKDHYVPPKEFWDEMERFQRIDSQNSKLYLWFTFISNSISTDIHPLINGLRRLRSPYSFYPENSSIIESSHEAFKDIVLHMGKDENMANFLFRKVLVDPNWNQHEQFIGIFYGEFVRSFPQYEYIPYNKIKRIYENLLNFVISNKNKSINRIELESQILSIIEQESQISLKPIVINTLIKNDNKLEKEICLNWESFFGGDDRIFPPAEQWNQILIGELKETKNWILQNSNSREIHILGNRRISASIALGHTFSAVSGFSLELNVKGEFLRTDSHPDNSTPEYPLSVTTPIFENNESNKLAVAVGIMGDISEEVKNYLSAEGKCNQPLLTIISDKPISSASQANLAVRSIKGYLSDALTKGNIETIDLFFAGPSFLALFLGHRLNATSKIQCYEWMGPNKYTPTCLLKN